MARSKLDELKDRLQQMPAKDSVELRLANIGIEITEALIETQANQRKIIDALDNVIDLIQEVDESHTIDENQIPHEGRQKSRQAIRTSLRELKEKL